MCDRIEPEYFRLYRVRGSTVLFAGAIARKAPSFLRTYTTPGPNSGDQKTLQSCPNNFVQLTGPFDDAVLGIQIVPIVCGVIEVPVILGPLADLERLLRPKREVHQLPVVLRWEKEMMARTTQTNAEGMAKGVVYRFFTRHQVCCGSAASKPFLGPQAKHFASVCDWFNVDRPSGFKAPERPVLGVLSPQVGFTSYFARRAD